jgi:DMSO/TMAO reductase YedYZ molybdopterin-dependent catalytic subunit
VTPLLRRAHRIVEAAAHRLEASGHWDATTRRDFLTRSAGFAAAALLAGCDSRGPAWAGATLDRAERQNEKVERWLQQHLAMGDVHRAARGAKDAGRAFPHYMISPTVPVWDDAARGPWRLHVTGLVERPLAFTLAELTALPQHQQRVHHFCVEGWTAVGTFWGVRVAELARRAGVRPEARVVDFRSFDAGYHESWDRETALHPQTLVAFAFDGAYLNGALGAPARVHTPLKLGYKNVKYLTTIDFRADRNGGYWTDRGYEWYAGT